MEDKRSETRKVVRDVIEGLRFLLDQREFDALENISNQFIPNWVDASDLYQPSTALLNRIGDYEKWCSLIKNKPARTWSKYSSEDPGRLLEEIACLAFASIKGKRTFKSYQSFAAQIDLAIWGDDFDWLTFLAFLQLPYRFQTIVVESKNLSTEVDDKQFGRFCGLIQNKFTETAKLGVFFTRNGYTGGPKRGSDRKRILRDAQATQILFHAKTGKFVVVLDDNDLRELKNPGSLPKILKAKIRAVEAWTGLSISFDEDLVERNDLPPHLQRHFTM